MKFIDILIKASLKSAIIRKDFWKFHEFFLLMRL